MNTFTNSWKTNQERVRTENGAATFNTAGDPLVDLFFQMPAMRGAPVDRLYNLFAKAFGEDRDLATRILLWTRDVRGGQGERKIFRDILLWLEVNDFEALEKVLPKVPELGRWDDLFVLKSARSKDRVYTMISNALKAGDGLCAKWMPRKGPEANELRRFMEMSPKEYRKTLVNLTNVVEQQMCSKEWGSIDYEKVPSLAQSRYSKAFLRHDEERFRTFGEKAKVYAEAVASGDKEKIASVEKVKINAGAVYPYDVLKNVIAKEADSPYYSYGKVDSSFDPNIVRAQWLTLPNYVGNKNILPMVDVSGSMESQIGSTNLRAIDVAVSLGLYMASKNTGNFRNLMLTFTSIPELITLRGDDVIGHVQQLLTDRWHGSTNVEAAFRKILDHAIRNRVPASDMPEYIVVFSDMEFNQMSTSNSTAFEKYREMFANHGYLPPKVVWWNIQSRQDNVPVRFDQAGTALVAGFSPSTAKSIMSGEGVNPREMMLRTVMDPRYDVGLRAA